MIGLNKISVFFRQHWLALILAVLVGLISIAPHLLTINALGDEYKGIPFFGADDNIYYTARIREILDGHGWVNSPYFYEYKNQPSLVLPIGEFFYALPSKLFNLSAPQAVLISKFLFPPILFFLVYFLISKLTKEEGSIINRINALAGGLFVTLGYDLIDFKNAWLFISGQIKDTHLLLWTRPVNPVTGALLFFVFLLLLWSIINNGRRYLFLPAGLILGLMIGYFFSWGTALSVLGILIIILLFKREFKKIKSLLLVILVSFLISSPYWYHLLRIFSSSEGRKISMLNGMFFTHQPMFNKVLLACLFIFLFCFLYEYFQKRKKKDKMAPWWWFCLSLLLGGLLALNQQIITGRTIWPYHFVQYTIPLSIVAMVVLFYNFVRPKLFRIWLIGVLGIFFSLLLLSITGVRSYIYGVDDMRKMQRYGDILEWLDNNTQKDCVLLIKENGEELTTLIPAFSHCNVYTSGWSYLSSAPKERIYHNFLVWLRMNGVTLKNINDFLEEHPAELRNHYAIGWQEIFNRSHDAWFEEKVKEAASAYGVFIKNDFVNELKRYRLDYIVSEGELTKEIKDLLPSLKFLRDFNGLFLYKI